MELRISRKKAIVYTSIGILIVLGVGVKFLPHPQKTNHNTGKVNIQTTSTNLNSNSVVNTNTNSVNNSASNTTTGTLADMVGITNTTSTGNSTIQTPSQPNTTQTSTSPLNSDASVSSLLGTTFVTVGIQASPVQALNGDFIGKLNQIETAKGNKVQGGVMAVPRSYDKNSNLLILSVKNDDLASLKQEIAQNWFLVYNGGQTQ